MKNRQRTGEIRSDSIQSTDYRAITGNTALGLSASLMLRLLPYMVIYNGLRYKIMKLPTKRRCLILRFCHGLTLSVHYSVIMVLVSGIVSEFLNMTFCIQNTDTVSPSPDSFQIHKVLIKFLCIFNCNVIYKIYCIYNIFYWTIIDLIEIFRYYNPYEVIIKYSPYSLHYILVSYLFCT